ncbi:hypothetical protein FA95DRAFT_1612142 [Auriscalpium vulgare]|uniref:Uncharacterized protein n=1 Tax=Auriscalpium vulgare TaxID=40419 RepID=A0ACB8R763_9AGAM|nr:hypothetical protein FA95DRAFT_1612142 [Auriscalpium vulgare]
MPRKKTQKNGSAPKVSKKNWTTLDQLTFLWAQLPVYPEHQAQQTTLDFWPGLYQEFLSRWPETALAGWNVKLSGEEGPPIRIRLKQWFNNKSRSANSGGSGSGKKVLDLTGRATRRLAPYQTYQTLYWTAKLQQVIEPKWTEYLATTPGAKASGALAFPQAFDKGVGQDVEEDASEERLRECQDAIDMLQRSLVTAMRVIYRQTGYMASILVGGPTPAAGGKIQSYSIHTSSNDRSFNESYAGFAEHVEKLFVSFLHKYFPQDACDARSLSPTPDTSAEMTPSVIVIDSSVIVVDSSAAPHTNSSSPANDLAAVPRTQASNPSTPADERAARTSSPLGTNIGAQQFIQPPLATKSAPQPSQKPLVAVVQSMALEKENIAPSPSPPPSLGGTPANRQRRKNIAALQRKIDELGLRNAGSNFIAENGGQNENAKRNSAANTPRRNSAANATNKKARPKPRLIRKPTVTAASSQERKSSLRNKPRVEVGDADLDALIAMGLEDDPEADEPEAEEDEWQPDDESDDDGESDEKDVTGIPADDAALADVTVVPAYAAATPVDAAAILDASARITDAPAISASISSVSAPNAPISTSSTNAPATTPATNPIIPVSVDKPTENNPPEDAPEWLVELRDVLVGAIAESEWDSSVDKWLALERAVGDVNGRDKAHWLNSDARIRPTVCPLIK